jgi:hypothetical protein
VMQWRCLPAMDGGRRQILMAIMGGHIRICVIYLRIGGIDRICGISMVFHLIRKMRKSVGVGGI